MLLIGIAPTTPILLAGVFLSGMAPGRVWAPFADVAMSVTESVQSRALALISTGTSVGVLLAGPAALVAGTGPGWHVVWVIAAVVTLAVTAQLVQECVAACVIENGKSSGVIGNEIGQNNRYCKLTPGWQFDHLTSMNYETESIHVGIAAADVAAVVLVAPDNSDSPGVLRDGAFIVRTKVAENSNQVTTNYVRATLTNGHEVVGPLRPN